MILNVTWWGAGRESEKLKELEISQQGQKTSNTEANSRKKIGFFFSFQYFQQQINDFF